LGERVTGRTRDLRAGGEDLAGAVTVAAVDNTADQGGEDTGRFAAVLSSGEEVDNSQSQPGREHRCPLGPSRFLVVVQQSTDLSFARLSPATGQSQGRGDCVLPRLSGNGPREQR